MQKTMRAAVVRAFGAPLVLEEVPVPTPGPGQILVKVEASGVCHTDLHAADGDWPVKPVPPFIPGHEAVGFVVACGSGVTHLRDGDRVGVPWLHDACGHCSHCWSGWETLCRKQQMSGYTVNGGYAEYVLAEADFTARLPDGPGFAEIAPILCAGVTVYKGLKETDTKPGEWVVISGIGGLGHCAVQYAKAMGLHVVAVDVSDDKVALARRLGADLAVNAASQDPAAFVRNEIGGAHGVLVTAASKAAFAQAIGMTRPRGTIALVGLPPGEFAVPIFDVVLNRITIRGSIVGTRQDLAEALDIAADGTVRSVVRPRRLNEINDVFDEMRRGGIEGRVVLTM